jgi:hypothetical protein
MLAREAGSSSLSAIRDRLLVVGRWLWSRVPASRREICTCFPG